MLVCSLGGSWLPSVLNALAISNVRYRQERVLKQQPTKDSSGSKPPLSRD